MVISPQSGKLTRHNSANNGENICELLCLNPEPQPPYQGHVLDLLQPAKQPTHSTEFNRRPQRWKTRSGLGASALEEGCSQLRSLLLFGGTPELSQLLAMVKRWLRGLRGLEARCFLRDFGVHMGPYFGDLFQQVLCPHRIESRLDLRQRSGRWTWAQSTVPKTQVSRHVESYRMPDLRKFGPQKCRISLLNWFFIESFQETMFFQEISSFPVDYPIIQFWDTTNSLKKWQKKHPKSSQGNASRCCGSVMRSVISPYGLGKHWWLVLGHYPLVI